jgi:hypothetical protein
MAAIALTPKSFILQGISPIFIKATTLTTLDWINIPNCRGVLGGFFEVASSTNNTAPGAATWEYGVALSTAAYATVTTTSIVIDGAGAHATITRLVPFFAKCKSGEIIEVVADSAPEAATATWTIRRGCLGTTPAAIADNDYFEIMNQLVLASTPVGTVTGIVFPIAQEPGANLMV